MSAEGDVRVGTGLPSKRSEHRANYTLERGVWHATCKLCGYQVSDFTRQRAAASYREHIREERLSSPQLSQFVIDLTDTSETRSRPRSLRS